MEKADFTQKLLALCGLKSAAGSISSDWDQPIRVVQDWEQDMVYLIQMPRAGCVPSLCPESLCLETWLRMANIAYRNVDNHFRLKSHKSGQTPFLELNGQQLAPANKAIHALSRHFGVRMDDWLSEYSCAEARAWQALVEDRLKWSCLYFRSLDNSFFASSSEGIATRIAQEPFKGLKLLHFRHIVLWTLRMQLKKQCQAQGIGHLSMEEVLSLTEEDFRALATFLAEKRFLMGERPCNLDAIAFGHLSQFHFCPGNVHLKSLLSGKGACSNIGHYLERLRDEFWPDWAEATGHGLGLDNAGWMRHRAKLETLAEDWNSKRANKDKKKHDFQNGT